MPVGGTNMPLDLASWFAMQQILLAVVQIWQAERSIALAKKTYNEMMAQKPTYEWFIPAIAEIEHTIHPDVLRALVERTGFCTTKYLDMLTAPSGTYFETDLDSATIAYMKCWCTELRRIAALNRGVMPTEHLRRMWDAYGCGKIESGKENK